jgi:hypothetical protein
MALFSKPPSKKPEPLKLEPKSGADDGSQPPRSGDRPVSAREVAHDARGKKGVRNGPASSRPARSAWAAPADGMVAFELVDRGPADQSGLCSVLENAALLFRRRQLEASRTLLGQGVRTDHDAKTSPLAGLALFDVLQRANDRAAFEQMARPVCRAVRTFGAGVGGRADDDRRAEGSLPRLHSGHRASLRRGGAAQIEGMKRGDRKEKYRTPPGLGFCHRI